MSDMSLMFPLGSLAKCVLAKKNNKAPISNKQEMTTRMVVSLIGTLLIIGVAVWMATECNTLVDYIISVVFPFNYVMIRLLAPCR